MFDEATEMLIEKFFDGALSAEEKEELERRISSDANLQKRIEDDAMVRSFFRGAAEHRFKPSFAERVLRDVELEAALSKTLAEHKADAFSPGFSKRVVDSIGNERLEGGAVFSEEFSDFLARLFPRVAAPAAAAALLAMVANANAAGLDVPIAEALFGLPSANASEFSFLNVG